MSDSHPVYVQVRRADGTSEKVRVGSAVRDGDGFVLSLGELLIGGTPEPARRAAPVSAPAGGGEGGEIFPPYGRSKGMPVRGATMNDLEYYANGCRRTLGDQSKARWHDKERQLLAAIEAEIERQGGSAGGGGGGGGGYGGGGGGGRYGGAAPSAPPSFGDDSPPPLTDDDIPF